MAKGDHRGSLTASAASITNPTNLTGSVANVAVGDLVFGVLAQQTALTAAGTVTDNLGNTYAYVNAGTDAGNVSIRCFYARVTTGGTLTQVSVPATASTNDVSGVASVIEGPFLTSPLDANPANATDGTSPHTCPATGVLAQASEVVMAACSLAANIAMTATSPGQITQTVARANVSCAVSRTVVSATTSVTPEFGNGATANAAQTTASFKLDPTQALTPSLFTDDDAFFTPTVTPGAVGLTPSLFTDADSFFEPTVASTYPLTPDLFTDSDTFFTPTVEQSGAGAQDLQPSLFSDTDSFFAPTVSPGAVDLAPALFSESDAFFAPTVAPGAVGLTPSLYSDTDAFFTPTVTSTVGLTPSLFAEADAFHSPTVAPGAVNLSPAFYADSDAFFSPTVAPGAVNLSPSLYSEADTFFTPVVTLEGGDQFLVPSLYTDADAFFSPTVGGTYGLAPALYSEADAFFGPTVSAGAPNLTPSLFVDGDVFFPAIVGGGAVVVDNRPAVARVTLSVGGSSVNIGGALRGRVTIGRSAARVTIPED